MAKRACQFRHQDGRPCGAPPLRGSTNCWMHDPDHAQEVAEARRLGGLRRKREVTLQGAYEFNGLTTVEDIRRLIEIAVLDTLGLENSLGRARTLAYLAVTALKALETGELEERVALLEAAVKRQPAEEPSAFDADPFVSPFEVVEDGA